jgi:hypothetical protein
MAPKRSPRVWGGRWPENGSKYFKSSQGVGLGGSIQSYDLETRSPEAAMLEEAWEDLMKNLAFQIRYPRILAKRDGKLVPLPIVVSAK